MIVKLFKKLFHPNNKERHKDTAGQFGLAKKRLASNPGTPPEVLEKLAQKCVPDLQERVAENAHTPSQTLEQLANHRKPDIRSAVAENMNTPLRVIESLAEDGNPDVRYLLAENANTPRRILKKLAEDDNPYVSVRALRTLESLQSVENNYRLSSNFS